MTAWRRRRRKTGFKSRRFHPGPDSALFFLTLIVIVETLALLFLFTGKISKKTPVKKSHVVATKKKAVSLPKKSVIGHSRQQIEKEPGKGSISKKEAAVVLPLVPKKGRGRIAIVIDDWGYTIRNLDILKEISLPLTLAILPFRDYSYNIADFAHRNNFEVIIHMPMEPENEESIDLEPNTLTSGMGKDKMILILGGAFKNISYAKGMNNHMGSLLTQDQDAMRVVFKELKKNKMFFLDSYVTPNTVCKKIAKEIGVKFAQRSIFLDNSLNSEYIRGQIMELVNEADKNGKAIGIGHDRRSTLKVLSEVMPQLTEAGYRFVFLSELVE